MKKLFVLMMVFALFACDSVSNPQQSLDADRVLFTWNRATFQTIYASCDSVTIEMSFWDHTGPWSDDIRFIHIGLVDSTDQSMFMMWYLAEEDEYWIDYADSILYVDATFVHGFKDAPIPWYPTVTVYLGGQVVGGSVIGWVDSFPTDCPQDPPPPPPVSEHDKGPYPRQ